MKRIKEILRLGTKTDLSLRQISKAIGVSRPVATKYLTVFKSSGLTYEEIKKFNDDEVYELFFINPEDRIKRKERYAYLSSKFEYLLKESSRTHVTLQKLWEEYIEENPDGYSRSQFFEHFNKWKKSSELTMHINHKAGDKVFVDFTGKKLHIVDKDTGKVYPVETFIAMLPASQKTFVFVTKSQKTEDWIKATEEAFWYFGGTTKAITPDCYKSAVKKHNRFEPEINPQYSQFASHYNTVILPARPAHPKDKALVENTVKIVYYWIYASLRDKTFNTIGELNRAILCELEKYNAKKMQAAGLSRTELFNKIEKQQLGCLPLSLYEYTKFNRATIQSNYHVLLTEDKRYYSIPYKYYAESIKGNKKIKAELYYTSENVEIYFKNVRIAFHKRNLTGDKYITNPAHMPVKHQRYLERWNPEKMINLAKSKGHDVAKFVEKLIYKHKHPEQSYNTCRGIIFLSKKYGNTRLNKACNKAIHFGYYSYKAIDDMLRNNYEEIQAELDLFKGILPEHKNIRGKEYFKERIKELISE